MLDTNPETAARALHVENTCGRMMSLNAQGHGSVHIRFRIEKTGSAGAKNGKKERNKNLFYCLITPPRETYT
jgi:hypothetical protein